MAFRRAARQTQHPRKARRDIPGVGRWKTRLRTQGPPHPQHFGPQDRVGMVRRVPRRARRPGPRHGPLHRQRRHREILRLTRGRNPSGPDIPAAGNDRDGRIHFHGFDLHRIEFFRIRRIFGRGILIHGRLFRKFRNRSPPLGNRIERPIRIRGKLERRGIGHYPRLPFAFQKRLLEKIFGRLERLESFGVRNFPLRMVRIRPTLVRSRNGQGRRYRLAQGRNLQIPDRIQRIAPTEDENGRKRTDDLLLEGRRLRVEKTLPHRDHVFRKHVSRTALRGRADRPFDL